MLEIAAKAREAGRLLAELSDGKRNVALEAIADTIAGQAESILDANRKDLAAAETLVAQGELSGAAAKRLLLDEAKLAKVIEGIRQVSRLADPLRKVLLARELDEGLILRQVTYPIGVIGVIFESRPDALPQIVSLCLKSGNAALLKGGKEAQETNRALFDAIQAGLSASGAPNQAFALLQGREEVAQMLKAESFVDLIIPRGSNELVRHIMDNTHIPVLGHAAGICHVFIDEMADIEKATAICLDSKTDYPAACNAAETILVHQSIAAQFLPELGRRLLEKGVEVRADPERLPLIKGAIEATADDFGHEFSDLIVAIKVVGGIQEAIDHVNRYGSHHTDCIVTEDGESARRFLSQVDSAGVFHNASTRFADGFRYGFGAEVGISNGKMHPRGPVGLEGLVTYRYVLEGNGHIASDYSGPDARHFTHRDL